MVCFFPANTFNMPLENVNKISGNVQLSKDNENFQAYDSSIFAFKYHVTCETGRLCNGNPFHRS